MKPNLLKSISILLLILNVNFLQAQCTGCQLTITVPNNTTYDLSSIPGQTICIVGTGTFTGKLNNFNGNTLCIGTGVNYNPSTAPNYNGSWTIINNGTFSNTTNLLFNSGVNFTNATTGTIALGALTINSGVNFVNNGTMSTTGITVNSGGNLTLGGSTTINGHLQNNGNIAIAGSVVANQITNNSGATIFGGTGTNCNSIRSSGSFTNNGIYGNTGTALFVGNTGGTINSPATTTTATAPTAAPTALNLSLSGSTVSGTFTQSASTNGYLILRAINAGAAPATTNPTNMTSLNVGQTLGLWTVVAINNGQTSTSFSDNVGITCNNIHYRIYSFNTAGTTQCRVYNTSSVLAGTLNPKPTISAVTPSTNTTICGGSSVDLVATSTGNTIRWYTVATGGTTIGTSASGATFTVTPTVNTTYYAEAYSPSGCVSATRTATGSVTVVNINPVIEFTLNANDHTDTISGCGTVGGGGQNDMDIFSGDPGTGSVYQWQLSDDNSTWTDAGGPTSTTTQLVLNPLYINIESVAGVHYIRLRITYSGCTGYSNVATLTVTSNSNLTPGTINSNQTFCGTTGDPAAFTATSPTGAVGGYSYIWQSSTDNINFNTISGATAATYNAPAISQTTYYRRIVVSGGCSAISNTVTVAIVALPTISSAATTTNVCFSTSAQTTTLAYSATTSSPTTYSITWNGTPTNSFVAVTNATLTAGTITINVPANTAVGTYTGNLTVRNANGCVSTNKTFTVTINAIPTITSTTNGFTNGSGTVLLGATASTGIISWYAAATGGSALGTGTSFTTPFITVTTTYYVETANGSCISNPRVAVIAYVNNPEMNVTGNSISIVDGDTTPSTPDNTDYGTIGFNVPVSKYYYIYNTGIGNLILTTPITITGLNASEYTVVTQPSTVIPAGGSTFFVITLQSPSGGFKDATVTIYNNDSNENPYNFDIHGNISAPEINVTGNGVAIYDGDTTPSTTDFTDFGAAALTRIFTIINSGSDVLNISSLTISGANASEFTVLSNPSSTILPGASSTFEVRFIPTTVGTRNATVNINSDDNDESAFNFAIRGYSNTEIDITGNYVSITDGDVTPNQADFTDFGTVSINASVIVTYTVSNTGLNTLALGTVTLTGLNPSDFTILSQPASNIAPGGTTTFQISFNPTVNGTKTAIITVPNNDNNEYNYNFTIAGTGIQTYADTDGDLITDNIDVDDDNDGILDTIEQLGCLSSPVSGSVNYVFLNETFGSGTTKGTIDINIPNATSTYCYEDGIVGTNTVDCPSQSSRILDDGEYCVNYKITGATASDPENIHGDLAWYDGLDHTTGDVNGRMAIFNASVEAGVFYETTISGVIPNVPIDYSFWALNILRSTNFAGSKLPNITVEFTTLAGTVISTYNTGDIGRCSASPSDNSCLTSNWLQFTTNVNLGNITAFKVRFINNAPGGAGNDLALDDIKISQQYCDYDGDGIPNVFDLDDDNDGISDIEEAGFKNMSNQTSTMVATNATLWADADKNGLNDTIDDLITTASYSIPDSDLDGIADYLDLDSDNDTQFDIDEAGLFNGDGDITGDGRGDGIDTDNDGILDLNDNFSGFGTVAKAYAQNTLGAENPDYINTSSKTSGIFDIATTLYANLDANNDGNIDGNTDADKDGILDLFDTNTTQLGSPRDLDRKLLLDFDGRNDYGQDAGILGSLANTSLMAWIDLNSSFSTEGIILGQNNFHLKVNSAKKLEVSANGNVLTSPSSLNTQQWYNVAAVYGGGLLKLYINGSMVASTVALGSILPDATPFTIGKDPSTSAKFFKGKIDEVRVFNVALTDSQLQKMVYQEIQNTSSNVRGTVVPKDIDAALPFNKVVCYYRMDVYKDDIIDNLTTPTFDTGSGLKIYNHKNIYNQQAPMPFVTERTGSFATAVNSPTNEVRGLDVMDQDWSIIQVKHDISETSNTIDLGMMVDAGKTITMYNDTKVQNDWYLKLDGKIDLQGRSQLIQTTNSDLDFTSAGHIERNQQGTNNIYNYNYWSSPVGTINTTTNNSAFTVDGVMKDGTTATPQNIVWTSGLNGSATSPITLSNYWIFKFQNLSNNYANWQTVGSTGSLNAAQGFTLKGSGTAAASQDYTFVGKPNNGTITTTVAANNLNLTGNPYASAIDANTFISNNLATTTGTLYLWEHYNTNTTHTLTNYQGGYAARNLVGGTPPVSPAGISGMGTSTKTPGRYIPVGQGYFVVGSGIGGTITYNNSQRIFVKESNASSSNLFKSTNSYVGAINTEDATATDTFKRVRLGMTSSDNYHRQILLGFMDENATNGIDSGYDAIHIDNQLNDMYFTINSNKLNIQGDSYFNINNTYPLGIKSYQGGIVKIMIDTTENFDSPQNMYIHDNTNDTYYEITNQEFEVQVPQGLTENRFSLTFKNNDILANENFNLNSGIAIAFTNANNTLNIKNNVVDTTVQSVALFNMLGQLISTFDIKDQNQENIQLPIKELSTGTYIVKIKTDKGDTSRKIIFN